MSFFKFDEENASAGFELVAEGKYEAVIVTLKQGRRKLANLNCQ